MSLAGSLLIAHPGLLDPNFRRTVIFISAHDPEDGSFGLVMNRPSGRTVSDVLPDREMGALGGIEVFLGGPVAGDQLIFASFQWNEEAQRLECRHHIDIEEAETLVAEKTATVRAFVGYAGWTKGQLEGELAEKAWLIHRPEASTLESKQCKMLWRHLLAGYGPWFQLIAEAPEDPSLN